MSKLNVQKIRSSAKRTPKIFAEFESLAGRIRERAQALFHERGHGDGNALDDWLRAEREFAVPDAALKETPKGYRIKVALAGFKPDDIRVTAAPHTVIVKAASDTHEDDSDDADDGQTRWSAFQSRTVYRRIDLDSAIDLDRLKVKLKRGMLKIRVRKAS